MRELWRMLYLQRRANHNGIDSCKHRRSVIQVAEPEFTDGTLKCDRDKPFDFFLPGCEWASALTET